MTAYLTGVPVTYTAVARTDGYTAGNHTYAWQFDDSTTASGASTNKTWSTTGLHTAVVTATNSITGGTATDQMTIKVRSVPTTWISSNTFSPILPYKTIAYGNGVYLAAAYVSTVLSVARSTDGINWTQVYTNNFTPYAITKIRLAYGNGRFCLTLQGSSAIQNIYTSGDNGDSWTSVGVTSRQWSDITYGNGRFVAVANGGGATGQFAYSDDGISFTQVNSHADRQWVSVAWNGAVFAAVALNQVDTSKSADGATWSAGGNSPVASTWDEITAGEGIFVARRFNSTTQPFMYSTDNGTTWALNTAITTIDVRTIAYGDGIFIANGNSIATNGSLYSFNGQTWTTFNQLNATWLDAVYNGVDRFYAINGNPTGSSPITQYLEW